MTLRDKLARMTGRPAPSPSPAPPATTPSAPAPSPSPAAAGEGRGGGMCAPPSASAAPAARIAGLRAELDALLKRHRAAAASSPPPSPAADHASDPAPPLPGAEVLTPIGAYHRVITRLPAHSAHGAVRLDALLGAGVPRPLFRGQPGRAAGFDARRALLLDTETTGLAGGTGTYAFLVGLAFFVGDEFQVHQLLMRDHGEEAALLSDLAALLPQFDTLVTYNGKAFDVPLLEARFCLARREVDLRRPAHLDLLFPARRLWRGRTENCRLATLEREICGFERTGDVPGAEIPGIYFEYLRNRNPARLARVLDHNRYDLLSLAALLVRVLGLVRDPRRAAGAGAEDLVRIARLYAEDGDLRAARTMLEEAACFGGGACRTAALEQLGDACRRLGDGAGAAAAWEALLAEPHAAPPPEVFLRLARHHLAEPGGAAAAVRCLQEGVTRARDLETRARLERALARAERRAR
ncbi:MAG: ribonuclease H-like domain-containing protein [Planctomycetes bacterium]|nr:ribonuclease H-like domain-containing protein [Planctomycetota bacterium]